MRGLLQYTSIVWWFWCSLKLSVLHPPWLSMGGWVSGCRFSDGSMLHHHIYAVLWHPKTTWVNKKSQGSTSCFILELSFKYFPLVIMPPFPEVSFGCGASDENEMCHQCRMADLFSGVAIPTQLHDYGGLADLIHPMHCTEMELEDRFGLWLGKACVSTYCYCLRYTDAVLGSCKPADISWSKEV